MLLSKMFLGLNLQKFLRRLKSSNSNSNSKFKTRALVKKHPLFTVR